MKRVTNRRRLALVATTLAATVALPAVSLAKPVCITNSINSMVLVIPKLKLKPGSNAVDGYFTNGTGVSSATGAVAVNTDVDYAGFTIHRGAVSVGTNSAGVGASSDLVVMLLHPVDGKIVVGDSGGGNFGGVGASYSVVDCATAPAIP